MPNDAPLHYAEFAAPMPLRRHVRCIWRMRGQWHADDPPEPIIPDGCAEVVLNFGDAFVRHTPEYRETQPAALVAGQITRAITIRPSGRIDLWGIRFHPWGAAPFLGFAGAELRDRIVSLGELAPHVGRDMLDVGGRTGESAQLTSLVEILTHHALRARVVDSRLASMISSVAAEQEFSVRGLARHAGLSVRRVQRLFEDDVGLSPKQMHRIQRIQRALALRRANPRLTWSAVAARAGYYDHAHLAHDASDLAGAPLTELLGDAGLTEVFLTKGD